MEVTGQGNVSVKRTHGGLLKLKDVKFIPRLKKSLKSVTQLATSSHKVVFDGSSWKILSGAKSVFFRVGAM